MQSANEVPMVELNTTQDEALIPSHSSTKQDIHAAVQTGDQNAVMNALNQTGDLTQIFDVQGLNLAHVAVMSGWCDVLTYIEQHDPDMLKSRTQFDKRTPLHFAAMHDQAEVIALLNRRDVDLEARDSRGYTAFQMAMFHAKKRAATALARLGVTMNGHYHTLPAIHFAASRGWLEVVDAILEGREHLDFRYEQDINDNTPLHYAVMNNHYDVVVRLLCPNRPENNYYNKAGFTLLNLALMRPNERIVLLLVQAGVDIRHQPGQSSLLDTAVKNNWGFVVQALLSRKDAPLSSSHPETLKKVFQMIRADDTRRFIHYTLHLLCLNCLQDASDIQACYQMACDAGLSPTYDTLLKSEGLHSLVSVIGFEEVCQWVGIASNGDEALALYARCEAQRIRFEIAGSVSIFEDYIARSYEKVVQLETAAQQAGVSGASLMLNALNMPRRLIAFTAPRHDEKGPESLRHYFAPK